MARRAAAEKKASAAAKAPPPFSPTVVQVPSEDFKISEAQFIELETAADVKLAAELRRRLQSLAMFWLEDLWIRQSPRPKQFRECLDHIEKTFANAEAACQWDRHPMYHLVHWAMESGVEGADGLIGRLSGVEQQLKSTRELIAALNQKLPPDPGRQRPFNDERRIIALADIFEAAGGKPVVYAGGYHEEGSMADTLFRRFAQLFYSFLPTEEKRDPGGFDDALRDALAVRRENRSL